MSIRVMTAIWDSGLYEGGTLLVLLALADWAADDGTKVFPKIATLAEKARLSVRGAQLCMARLKEDGVLVEVEGARRGKATEYKIVLVRVQELHRNECTATISGENKDAVGVQSATVGMQSDASHIDNHQEPSVEPPYAGEDALSHWPEVWAAFKTWPNLPETATEHRARSVVERMLGELPPLADLAQRVLAHGRSIRAANERRGRLLGSMPCTAPHNWLERDRGWEVETEPAVDQAAIDAAADKADRYFKRGKYAEVAA